MTAVSAQPTAAGVQVVYVLSAPAEVGIEVRNMAGRQIAVISQGIQEAGTHTAVWTRRASSGTRVPNGQYLLSMRSCSEDGTQTNRIVPVLVR